MQTNDLSKHDLERIEELKTTFGFEVVNAGFTCNKAAPDKDVQLCYWRNKRGVRESAIFPNHEAAWRDALRVHEEATDAVKANPGIHRIKSMPAEVAKEHSRLKKLAIDQGYEFRERRGEHAWIYNGLTEAGHNSHADSIKGAIRHWARRDPESFVNSMNILGSGSAQVELTPLTSEELAKLQGIPGFKEMPDEHQELTLKQQVILKNLKQRGIQFDTSMISADQLAQAACVDYSATLASSIHDDTPLPTVIIQRQRGKSFEEVEEDQRNAKRAYGLVEGSAEEKKLRHLEAIGYEFFFTAAWGWKCKPDVNASGALETVVRAAWAIAVKQEGADKYDLLDAMGLPYIGSTVWAQNDPEKGYEAQGLEEERLVKVLAYDGMTAWLKLCSDMGEPQEVYTTARIEKIKIRGWKGNCDA